MKVIEIKDSIVDLTVDNNLSLNELVVFENNEKGIVIDISQDRISVLVNNTNDIKINSEANGVGSEWSVKPNKDIWGRIIDTDGNIIHGNTVMSTDTYSTSKKVFSKAPMFYERKNLNQPLLTGIFSIDALFPIGRGQRELIIGDRKTGKTSIALHTIINQKDQNIKVIYASIGQKQSSINDVYDTLKENNALDYTTIVMGDPNQKFNQYAAPYYAMALAESIAKDGEDVLVILDDLTKHANIYREISLKS